MGPEFTIRCNFFPPGFRWYIVYWMSGPSIPPYVLEKVDVRIQKIFIFFGRGRSFVLVNLGAD